MNAIDALRVRKSVRAFTKRAVSDEQLRQMLDASSHAPSGVNTQPWQVAVLRNKTKDRLCSQIEGAFREGKKSNKDYEYYPTEWREPYLSRRKACGLALYSALNISKEDVQRRQDQWAANYRAFDAPVMLLFFIDRTMGRGSYLDYGMFLQALMLAAVDLGLSTCSQAALAEYPDIVREALDYDESMLLLCGMAVGYEDTSAPVNNYRTEREPLENFTRFFP
ncbi:MAG: nitroreductase [Cellvibrionaceae bacterium]|jgi:nitroreductase